MTSERKRMGVAKYRKILIGLRFGAIKLSVVLYLKIGRIDIVVAIERYK